jgi:hypothetical protein
VSRDFRPLFFLLNNFPQAPDARIEAFLQMAWNSRRYSTLKSLREFEAIFEKALTRESGAQMGLFDEKKPEVENLVGTLNKCL